MTADTRDNLAHFRDVMVRVVISLAAIGGIVWVSLTYWNDDRRFLVSIALQAGAAVILYKIYRWWRWPGTWHARTSGRLIRDVMFSVLFVWSFPLIALIARFHLLKALPLRKIVLNLDLTFLFFSRERVQVSRVAPLQFCPGQWGRIRAFRVVGPNDHTLAMLPVGSTIYRVGFGETELEVPECELIPPD